MSKIKLKKGDTVKVISGESRGTQGKIVSIDIKKERAIVEGVNMLAKAKSRALKTLTVVS